MDEPQIEQMTGAAAGRDLSPLFRWVAGAMVVLVLIQAVLAGRAWFFDYDLFDVHGGVGDFVLLVAIAQVVIAFVAMNRGSLGQTPLWLSVALLLLVFVQLGLGYSGRDSNTAASLHVPNGVLIMAVSVAAFFTGLPARAGRAA